MPSQVLSKKVAQGRTTCVQRCNNTLANGLTSHSKRPKKTNGDNKKAGRRETHKSGDTTEEKGEKRKGIRKAPPTKFPEKAAVCSAEAPPSQECSRDSAIVFVKITCVERSATDDSKEDANLITL